jgi:hypothetical protein
MSTAAAALLLGTAACGDDDDDDAASETTAAAETTHPAEHTQAPATTAASTEAATADVAAFCEAEVAAEAAAASEDPAVMGPAFEALVAAAPADLTATVEAVIANAEAGPGTPEFDGPYGEMIAFMQGNCGFGELALTASEYAFGGLPDEVAAGSTIITLENIGEEVHEIIMFKVNDGVTETADELMALPEEEVEQKMTFQAAAFGFPGATAHTVTGLTPGRYIALCFLPQGATPEVISQMEGPEDSLPPGVEVGPPHFTQGMIHEFVVA